jgi:hypothetical protein
MDYSKEYILFEKYSVKQITSIVILVWINLLFSYKYLDRYISFPFLATLIFGLMYSLLWFMNFYISKRTITVMTIIGFVLFLIGALVVFDRIPVEDLRVDRWSVIAAFWENYFQGEYVYYARSFDGNPPGAMPFYFILALPFYLAGEPGLMALAGLFLYTGISYAMADNKTEFFRSFLFLIFSLFIVWEVTTRSNLFFNSTLILLLLIWLEKIDKHKFSFWLAVNAFVCGLLLSTRFVLVIPLIIQFTWLFRTKKMKFNILASYGVVACVSFFLTYIPFIIFHFNDFLMTNPFLLQTTLFIPFAYILGFLFLSFSLSFICKDQRDVYLFSGIALFVSILIYFLYHTIQWGLIHAYMESVIDISYFIFCAPFLIYFIVFRHRASA